jgi:hypothetical protein
MWARFGGDDGEEGLAMGLRFENLDDDTRRCMLEELDEDVARGTLYLSPRLSEIGQVEFESLLRRAIESGSEVSLAEDLRAAGRMRSTSPWKKGNGGGATMALPATAPDHLAECEFHRFYARGLCRRALQEKITTLQIYRARADSDGRSRYDSMIGVRIDAGSLLEDLQTRREVAPPSGLPQCPDSGLSVRIA